MPSICFGDLARFLGTLRQLYAAAFAATAGVNLRLNYDDSRAQVPSPPGKPLPACARLFRAAPARQTS